MDDPKVADTKQDDVTTDDDAQKSAVVLGDPLASVPADDAATDDAAVKYDIPGEEIVPNDTVTTNDDSDVGEFKAIVPPAPVIEMPLPEPEPIMPVDPQPLVPPVMLPQPEDPAKVAFIKTYTKEFDDALARAIDAIQKTLDSIDSAVREHTADIVISDEANEFLAKAPSGGKVQRFEDAREVIREIIEKATEIKGEAAQAAEEAAKVYDEVQEFKRETKEQIAALESEEPLPVAPEM
jgi:hypothetical protein